MAVPKRRQSKSRTAKRRSSHKLAEAQFSLCPQCKAVKKPHRICSECGYYGDKKIVKDDQEK